MIYFHTYKTETQLNIDIVSDIRRLNDMSVHAKKAGMIILGGGVCKHQIANAMLFVSRISTCSCYAPPVVADETMLRGDHGADRPQRNGADYAVYINTGQEVSIPVVLMNFHMEDQEDTRDRY